MKHGGKMNFIFIADGWGPQFGGINAFNYDLCSNLRSSLDSNDRAICITCNASLTAIKDAEAFGVELISLHEEDFSDVTKLANEVENRYGNSKNVFFGHDVYTGPHAKRCAEIMNSEWSFFHHMAYSQYYTNISNDAEKTEEKHIAQKELIATANYVFAIGPKLKSSAEDMLLTHGNAKCKKVIMVLPGLANIQPLEKSLNQFRAITFGRMDDKVDVIKQGKLALASFTRAMDQKNGVMKTDDQLRILGLSSGENTYQELMDFTKGLTQKRVNLYPLPYTNNRKELFDHIKGSSLCMMLSFHEGFGLVGLEAISAGIPVILSENSGLYDMLCFDTFEGAHQYIHAVSIDGSPDCNSPCSESDIVRVANLIEKIREKPQLYKENALKLRELLDNKGLNWGTAANLIVQEIYKNITEHSLIENQKLSKLEIQKELHDKIHLIRKFSTEETVLRHSLIDNIGSKLENHNIIVVEGFKGIGKKRVVASYYQELSEDKNIIVYKCETDDTVDTFLSNIINILGTDITISDHTEILNQLCRKNVGVIIDGFIKTKIKSFKDFFKEAENTKYNIPLFLICSEKMPQDWKNEFPAFITVEGFSKDEYHMFLDKLKLDCLSNDLKERLFARTHGHPYAIKIFANLVNEFNQDPTRLLKGKIVDIDKTILNWIKDIFNKLSESQKLLLGALSVVEIPFNETLMNNLVKEFSDCNVHRYTFTDLQKRFLVSKITKFNWEIKPLISDYAVQMLSSEHKNRVHAKLGKYYELNTKSKFALKDPELKAKWAIQSIKQYQLAQQFTDSKRMIGFNSKNIKRLGLYETYIRIAFNEIIRNPNRDYWTDYHYAHILVILGRLEDAEKALRTIFSLNTLIKPEIMLCSKRLMAELLIEKKKPKRALQYIEEGEKILIEHSVDLRLISHFKQIKSLVLIENGDFDNAELILKSLISNVDEDEDKYATAISLTRLACCDKFNYCFDEREEMFEAAIAIFKEVNDKRGYSWSKIHLIFLKLSSQKYNSASDSEMDLIEVLDIKKKTGECSYDYKSTLKRLCTMEISEHAKMIIDLELNRIQENSY